MLFLYKKNSQNTAMKFITYFVVLYCLGFILFILRNQIPDFLSIVIANTFFALGSLCLYVAIRAIVGLNSKWQIRYWIPILIVFVGFYIFTLIDFNPNMRALIYSVFVLFYSLLDMWLFGFYASSKFYIFDKISSMVFFVGFVIFSLVAIESRIIHIDAYYFNNVNIIIYLPNIYMLMLNLWIISLVTYRIKN
jgi:hypothetical protein